MASPSEKYSKSANSITSATANASTGVDPNNTAPAASGISTAAVATLVQVIERSSPEELSSPYHHIEGKKSRLRPISRVRMNDHAGIKNQSDAGGFNGAQWLSIAASTSLPKS